MKRIDRDSFCEFVKKYDPDCVFVGSMGKSDLESITYVLKSLKYHSICRHAYMMLQEKRMKMQK